MKKTVKNLLIFLIALIFLLILFSLAWAFFIFPNFISPKDEVEETETRFHKIAKESEKIDFNESNGMLYVNNEVVVFIKDETAKEKISALFDSFDAEVDESMSDINVYRLSFKKSMTYEELESLIKKIKSDSIVDNAYLNTVSEFESDTSDAKDDFKYKSSFFPDDPWNDNISWNVSAPHGVNWGVEAIDAPGAWGYLDQMSNVKIGLIDAMPDLSHEDLSFANSTCYFIDKDGNLTANNYSVSAEEHGTHVSGTMNARFNNSTGVSGVMGGKGELYFSEIYSYSEGKSYLGLGTAYSYILVLKTLIDQDVQVINISMGFNGLTIFAASRGNKNAINIISSQADLIEEALSRIIKNRENSNKPDFVICVAAGNENNTDYYKDDNADYGYRENPNFWEKFKRAFGWRGDHGNAFAHYGNSLNLIDDESVKNRIIVVGAVEIDHKSSTSDSTKYSYADFSNVGSRVDIVAPGVDVYSYVPGGYKNMRGTSMATPHVSGVAGLIFACNPSLTGPDVKNILTLSTTGRYYHGAEYSGLLNANNSVVNALKTEKAPVKRVLKTETDGGLDLCFVVDTTESMEDDIDNAKKNMTNILTHLAAKTENYRVALIDYRDYPDRTDRDDDYPAKMQLSFTNDTSAITDAINGLSLGFGGDNNETVYSGLMSAVNLPWRSDAKKVIIVLGDAPPLDPEPYTDYTYNDILLAVFNSDINIDYKNSDERVIGAPDESLINVFSIGTDASDEAADFFKNISAGTGGSYAGVDDASKVGDAIIDSIEQIEVVDKLKVKADFGQVMANRKIDLYSEDGYMFSIETDESGRFVIDSIAPDTYRWTSNSLYNNGYIEIDKSGKNTTVKVTYSYWFTPLLKFWYEHKLLIFILLSGYLILCVTVPILLKILCGYLREKKEAAANGKILTPTAKQERSFKNFRFLKGSVSTCPDCGASTPTGSCFCEQCGHDLQAKALKTSEHICKNCGNRYKESEIYCAYCGKKLEKE